MSKELERWDCIFVDKIGSDGRIYLTQPQKRGNMYADDGAPKVRKSVPTACGKIAGSSNLSKMLKVIAIATAYNRQSLNSSNGLVVTRFDDAGQLKFLRPMPPLVAGGVSSRIQGTTEWIAYVSLEEDEEEFYLINGKNGRYKSAKLTGTQSNLIRGCIEDIIANWHANPGGAPK